MGHRPREQPERLAPKLLQIRQCLGLSQSQIGQKLGFKRSFNRVSEYESGNREPNLIVLLAYARIARVSVTVLIDDKRELPQRFEQTNQS